MDINSENLLFRHSGIKLPESELLIFDSGGGLQSGEIDFMGIKSHRKQKIWDLLDEFEPDKDDRLDNSDD